MKLVLKEMALFHDMSQDQSKLKIYDLLHVRSVVVFGRGELVTSSTEKVRAMLLFTNNIIPNR